MAIDANMVGILKSCSLSNKRNPKPDFALIISAATSTKIE